ncbi:aminotransferase [Kribbella jiaozuonensis]|uniref:Aminotransferase n=1 Tax=Kribbella jiaozuonensis TaxID=2575441 RepID=A0A4U3LL14_9ACTN|nr:aminotransferase [Kribbella jiaozuonensis]TKK76280.1 aminotransferase [Kribbella jiaozuonensis]
MTQTFNFFEQAALPAPEITVAQAAEYVRATYGIEGEATELGSQQDANFLVSAADAQYVLKVSNAAFTREDLAAQDLAAAHVARHEADIQVPGAVPGPDGSTVQPIAFGGRPTYARLVTFVAGDVLSDSAYLAPEIVAALGDLAARTSRALAGLGGEVPARSLQWDLRNAAEVVTRLADFVTVPGGPDAARAAASTAAKALAPYAGNLPLQVIHGDLTDDNVIATVDADGRRRPVGVIDFGDLTESWSIAELAVTCTSLLYHSPDLSTMLPAIVAYDRIRPISDDELAALGPLVVLRAAALMVSGQQQTQVDRDNRYASENLAREWAIFEQATSVPLEVLTELIRASVRPRNEGRTIDGSALLWIGDEPVVPAQLDLSTTSVDLHDGGFLLDEAEEAVAKRDESAAVAVPFLQPRLTRTRLNSFEAPASVGLGVEVFAVQELELRAPWAGVIQRHDDAVALKGRDGVTLWLSGASVDAEGALETGDALGQLTPGAALRVQLTDLETRPPFFIQASLADAWAGSCPDPTGLIDAVATPPTVDHLLERRESAFAPVQEHYFREPPQIERGWRNHLFDTEGRSYLDMVNNVSILGHGHPRLAAAVEQQWRLLNTNSRFHYRAVVEFSERLSELLPEPLDAVFLVNSGTEADDLALRLAWANTGRRDVIAVREAYHGWSDATDAISTSVADNPNALHSRPSWVHTVAAPNAYRGQYRGPDAYRYAEDAVAYINKLSPPPAAFLSESFYGNAGGMALPDGYLQAVYAAVRRAGGLCIADEVQVGYGRLGNHFWGFEQQGVVPDIVTVAKAMGNGHPLGAVITTAAIAAGYRSQGYFFSSAGGSPVSCVAGTTVLDVLRDEQLQENARVVGDHLRMRLLELADRHPIIGAVHGMGLYVGVELVRDRITLEPAAAETAAICERMRELGVIMQPTSDRLCVLKIKPPLGVTITDADFFADALDRVLTEGW